ncbi:MAG TPA: hypothetical protein VHK24_13120 [Steroidobacter sp.]|jgi:catechol 2,3-dioxygenase-like lactoylglutathione lyase family enzyme|nr:hypothetical protein [Steroidobacter sp.]
MLGRFLEISAHAPDIQESLAFYESLGFVQATVGEAWPHPYAVVTDGRLFLGLHSAAISAPALTFVLPQLRRSVERLRSIGVEFEDEELSEQAFNRAGFRDPAGIRVNLLEARTFSPPQLERAERTKCGYFTEFAIPVRETASASAFWQSLGFVALERQQQPFPRAALTSDFVNLSLYGSRAFRTPLLTFEDERMRERIAQLRQRHLPLIDEMPDSLDADANAVLIAPEGTRLLLMQAES